MVRCMSFLPYLFVNILLVILYLFLANLENISKISRLEDRRQVNDLPKDIPLARIYLCRIKVQNQFISFVFYYYYFVLYYVFLFSFWMSPDKSGVLTYRWYFVQSGKVSLWHPACISTKIYLFHLNYLESFARELSRTIEIKQFLKVWFGGGWGMMVTMNW